MSDIAHRHLQNPLLQPSDVRPSHADMVVECLLNPGVFRFDGQTWLIVRVAERPQQVKGKISFPILRREQANWSSEVPSSSRVFSEFDGNSSKCCSSN